MLATANPIDLDTSTPAHKLFYAILDEHEHHRISRRKTPGKLIVGGVVGAFVCMFRVYAVARSAKLNHITSGYAIDIRR